MRVEQAPAKINLALTIERRRADGYHDISTVFLKISLVDTLSFEAVPDGITMQCNHPTLPCDAQNLVYRAAQMLQPLAPGRGVRVVLHKQIPVAAGLGGGSSDAAATLRGLNQLWELHLSRSELMSYAERLGADVPFFLLPDRMALGRGRGDELTPLVCPENIFLVLVTPPVSISTAWVYGQFRFELTGGPKDTTILMQYLESGDIACLGSVCHNDLETVVLPQFPVVGAVKQALSLPGIYGVCMSGSGPTVYALCPSQEVADRIHKTVELCGWPVWVCRPWQDTVLNSRD